MKTNAQKLSKEQPTNLPTKDFVDLNDKVLEIRSLTQELSPNARKLLVVFMENPHLTSPEYSKIVGITPQGIYKHLNSDKFLKALKRLRGNKLVLQGHKVDKALIDSASTPKASHSQDRQLYYRLTKQLDIPDPIEESGRYSQTKETQEIVKIAIQTAIEAGIEASGMARKDPDPILAEFEVVNESKPKQDENDKQTGQN